MRYFYLLVFPLHLHQLIFHLKLPLLHFYQLLVFGLQLLLLPGDLQQRLHLSERGTKLDILNTKQNEYNFFFTVILAG